MLPDGWLVFRFGYGNLKFSVTEPKAKTPEQVTKAKSPEEVTVEQLLCDVPLHSPRIISDLFSQPQFGSVDFPDEIRVHCDHEKCGGERRHVKYGSRERVQVGNNFYVLFAYLCTNCERFVKAFGLKAERFDDMQKEGRCTKFTRNRLSVNQFQSVSSTS